MTITELNKEKMTCRATNPIRSNLIGFVLAEAKSNAKEAGRLVEESDFLASAVSWKKRLTKTLPEMVAGSDRYQRTEKEIEELSTFLPIYLSEDETEMALTGIISTLEHEHQKDRKMIMEIAKNIPNLDTGLANKVLTTILKTR